MTLSIDNDLQKVIAELEVNDNALQYECRLSACENPVCTCGTVSLDLMALKSQGQIDGSQKFRQIDLDVYEKTLSTSWKNRASSDEVDFAGDFLSQLSDEDFDLLYKKYFAFKNKVSEQAAPEEIDAVFDYQEIEVNGLMYCYNDVLPYGDHLTVTLNGKECLILDQFCLLPHCSCTDAHLTLMPAEYGRRPDNREVEPDLCEIDVTYARKKWTLLESSQSWPAIETIKSSIEAHIPGFYDRLRRRHMKMKAIYASCKQRNSELDRAPRQLKIGRNDPCPCGSGKKYKKCCLKPEK